MEYAKYNPPKTYDIKELLENPKQNIFEVLEAHHKPHRSLVDSDGTYRQFFVLSLENDASIYLRSAVNRVANTTSSEEQDAIVLSDEEDVNYMVVEVQHKEEDINNKLVCYWFGKSEGRYISPTDDTTKTFNRPLMIDVDNSDIRVGGTWIGSKEVGYNTLQIEELLADFNDVVSVAKAVESESLYDALIEKSINNDRRVNDLLSRLSS